MCIFYLNETQNISFTSPQGLPLRQKINCHHNRYFISFSKYIKKEMYPFQNSLLPILVSLKHFIVSQKLLCHIFNLHYKSVQTPCLLTLKWTLLCSPNTDSLANWKVYSETFLHSCHFLAPPLHISLSLSLHAYANTHTHNFLQ